ncbi:MAG: CvpA family protein [Blautia sp.]|nr:CvpA family protein [Blautia sp.]
MNGTWISLAAAAVIALFAVIGYNRGFVKEVISMLFIFIAIAIVWFINPYVNQFLREHTPLEARLEESCLSAVEALPGAGQVMNSEQQTALAEETGLPSFMISDLLKNNQQSIYQMLGVDSFIGYVAKYLAATITNAASFLVSFLLAWILLRLLAMVLDLFTKLPVIRGVNKLAGGILGGAKCIVVIWIIMLILVILCNTEFGRKGLSLIGQSRLLSWLYDNNILAKIFAGFLGQSLG